MRNMADEIKRLNENLKFMEQKMSMTKKVISLLSTRIVDSKRQCCVNQQYETRMSGNFSHIQVKSLTKVFSFLSKIGKRSEERL